jgi:hypothetical protein
MTYFRKFALAAVIAFGAITVAATGMAVMTEQAEAVGRGR